MHTNKYPNLWKQAYVNNASQYVLCNYINFIYMYM